MGKDLVDRVCESWADSLIEAVESWQEEHRDALDARHLEEVIEVAHAMPAQLRSLWKSRFRRILAGEITDIQETRTIMDSGLYHLTRALDLYREVAEDIEKNSGHKVHNLSLLLDDLRDLRRLREEMLRDWPSFGAREFEETKAAVARGEAVPVEEAFAEAAGISKEEMLRRLEEHAQKRRRLGLK